MDTKILQIKISNRIWRTRHVSSNYHALCEVFDLVPDLVFNDNNTALIDPYTRKVISDIESPNGFYYDYSWEIIEETD